jgi:cellulose 1,4-beta-cellobiosidase
VPAGLAKANVTSSSITLSWNASTDPDSPVQGYNIYRGGTLRVGNYTSLSFTDTGLTPNTSYSYTVSAFDPSNNASAQSTALAITTAGTGCSFSVPNVSNGAACTCTGNCYDNSWDGCFTIQNTGSFAMTNPVVTFKVPSSVTDISGTSTSNVPAGFTETANLSNGTVTMAYTGTLAAGASILVYYTDNNQTQAAAASVAVTASNCQ